MHILIAPDSFKESLTAEEVAICIQTGLSEALPTATFDLMPVGDGGEGTIASLNQVLGAERQELLVTGPFGEQVVMPYGRKGSLALFEMADLVGLGLIPREKRNPLALETRGLGELLVHLAKDGVTKVLVGVGGSATNDGGLGLAAGLGYAFFDEDGHRLQAKGSSLGRVARVSSECVPKEIFQLELQILTDVCNPLCGPEGATYVFGEQKGLPSFLMPAVDQAMEQFYSTFYSDVLSLAGAGAGGGVTAGLVAFAGGKIVSGIDVCLDLLDFEERCQKADLLIVGEGKMDRQSIRGKAPFGVARRAPKHVPVLAICGSLGADLPAFPIENIKAAFSILRQVESLEETLLHAKENVIRTARNIGNILKISE
ncbi:glycerate kinase family protein [Streptococcus himalayensis]|uniref:Glycerate kinase n=1 Tax=Streptococcus himalayensis TaxID=1888195 RepID=A0A917EFQ0_9STRE|nr:glycerate kinase [Streptococcus himalayensis]GGE29309.1 glycerate kinase [Streptococcus himalayensis]